MRPEQVIANVKLRCKGKVIKLKALVDAGASKSVISKRIADELRAFVPIEEPYELRTADERGRLRIVWRCMVGVVFQGVKVPGGAVFEVAEDLRRGVSIIVGRPEIDAWDVIFTPKGLRPRKVPIEFEVI